MMGQNYMNRYMSTLIKLLFREYVLSSCSVFKCTGSKQQLCNAMAPGKVN